MALLFQYGSNMSPARLNSANRLRGDAKSLGLAQTADQYELDFTVWSTGNRCAATDLVPNGSRRIWGVLYQVPDELLARETSGARKSMDEIEGRMYQRHPIVVCREGSSCSPLTAWTYTVINKVQGLKTSFAYARHLLCGLREHSAPAEYMEYVKGRILSNNPKLQGRL
jgi:hypothetical protein